MAKKSKAKAPKAPAAPKEPKFGSSGEVSVLDANGAHIRTYSKAQHGPKFVEYAKEFAGKVAGRKLE